MMKDRLPNVFREILDSSLENAMQDFDSFASSFARRLDIIKQYYETKYYDRMLMQLVSKSRFVPNYRVRNGLYVDLGIGSCP